MKKILILGESSYIGESFALFAGDRYNIDTVSSINYAWKNHSFSDYDCILHCAGIAHADHKRSERTKALYYSINCDLAIEVAEKAKAEGVSQFIFLSSILVYGNNNTNIDFSTAPNPENFYAESKLNAEKKLQNFADDNFHLCIVRPPMVYGPNCKGNFPRLVGLAKKVPIFPDFQNKRSMIFIDNLCSFFCKLIDDKLQGIYLPQNTEYVNTSELVQCIAKHSGKQVNLTKLFNPIIRLLKNRVGSIGKMFGDLTYAKSGDEISYNVVSFGASVKKSLSPHHLHVSAPPTVSIITVTFNSEKTLEDTLKSVLNQTASPMEYIIVDGVSTDGTGELAESYRNAFEAKGIEFKIISESDNGIYDAMNKGIRNAKGDIIGMINSDDWYEPTAIKRAIETYQKTGYDMMFADLMVYPDSRNRSAGKPFIKKAGLTKWVHSRNWNHPTTFTHKRIYAENKFALESIYDDFDLYLKLRKEKKNIVIINEVLANYRLGGMSNKKGFSHSLKRTKARYSIYRKNGYSRIYIFECLLIEGAKFLLT